MYLYCLAFVLPWSLVAGYCEGGCYTNGHCYKHGDTWTENCIERRCRQMYRTNAIVETLRVKCKDVYGRCVNHGDTMSVSVGRYIEKCRCQVGTNRWDSVQCSSGSARKCDCDIPHDGCKSFGEQWTSSDCFKYECKRAGSSWIGAVVGAVCKDANGVCRKSGEKMSAYIGKSLHQDCLCTVQGNSRRYQCSRGRENPRPESCSATGCTVDGICHNIGSEWTTDCVTYRCDNLGGFWRYATIVRRKCKDAYGYCRNHGEIMKITHGRRTDNCVCEISEKAVDDYSISAPGPCPQFLVMSRLLVFMFFITFLKLLLI